MRHDRDLDKGDDCAVNGAARQSRQPVCIGLVLLFLTPTGCYLARESMGRENITQRQPIAKLIEDKRIDALERGKLSLVLAARQYAKDSIRLKTNDSFTTYSRLDSDTLVLVLSAAYRDRLESYTWWFPIVGRVPYKGFFDFDEAKKAAKSFYDDGYDVALRPSSAFSTLGWFNDPLTARLWHWTASTS